MYVGSKFQPRHLILSSDRPERQLRELLASAREDAEPHAKYAQARHHPIGDEAGLRAALARHATRQESATGQGREPDVPVNTPASFRDLLRQLRAGEPLHQFILQPEQPTRRYLTESAGEHTLLAGRFSLSVILDLGRYAIVQAMGAGRLTLLAARRRGQLATYAVCDERLEGFARSEAHFTPLPSLLERANQLEAASWLDVTAIEKAAADQSFSSFFEKGALQVWTGPRWVHWALGQMPEAARQEILSEQITDPEELPETNG